MKSTRFIAYTIIVVSAGLTAVHAQSLRDKPTPAEFPPATYKGAQYVDSKGCVFIRAGIDGNVTWVPRVSRTRQQICGYEPSLTAAQIARAPSLRSASSATAPVQITVAPSASVPARPAQIDAPTKPKSSTTAPAPVATVTPTPKPAPAAVRSTPAKTARRTPRPAPEPLLFVNPPPERVAVATVPTAPTKTRKKRRTTPRPAPEPLLFVNPPPERVAAATTPVAPKTSPLTQRSAPRPAPAPLLFVNPPPTQTATVSAPATPVAPVRRKAQGRAPRPEPQPLIFVNPPNVQPVATVAPTTSTQTAQRQPSCPGASALSQQYINSGARYPVRCGPQAEALVSESRRPPGVQSGAMQSATVSPSTRIVPVHVYEQRQNTTAVPAAGSYQNVDNAGGQNQGKTKTATTPVRVKQVVLAPPPGYKPAWDDDRLNPERGVGTVAGETQTNQIWTRTVPRKLIVQPLPDNIQTLKLSSRNPEAAIPRVSSRSELSATPPKNVDKPKYVRVAMYDSDKTARATAQNLAKQGLPMRLGTVTRKGKAYRVVLAGPFASTDQATAALAKVRGAGFSRAKINK